MSPRKIRRRKKAKRWLAIGPISLDLTERDLVETLDPGMLDWMPAAKPVAQAA